MPLFVDKKSFCEKINGNESSFKRMNKCFVMLLHNLAEPKWLSVDCNTPFLVYVICIKDKIIQEIEHINNRSIILKMKHFCASNAIIVDGICYDFQWIDSNTNIRCKNENIKIDIMIFKYIFEAISLEDKYLSAFVRYNLKTISSVTFVRYLDTVTFFDNISLSDGEGYIICPSIRFNIQLGTHIFNYSGGGNVLYHYICDGTVDCPNDRSDEDSCACNESKHSKMCKTIYHGQNFNTCSSIYYMAKDGSCLKYTSPKTLHQIFQINLDAPRYITMKISKLVAFQQKVNNTIKLDPFSKFIKYFRCLYKGDLPCWEGYFQCYNITHLCIYKLNTNKILIPCENGKHLQQCKKFLYDIMFKCLDNYCISWSYVCDGKWDCPHGDDELEYTVCNKNSSCLNMYHCRNTAQMCLHLGNICDGYPDCPFGDDEILCELKSVECPSFCVCLLYAIYCRMFSDHNVKAVLKFHYLFVHFSNFKIDLESHLMMNLTYAAVVNLQTNYITDIYNAFRKLSDWKCILLDLSFNLLKSIENNCFSNTKFLKLLTINDNNIKYVEKKSFHGLSNLRYFNLTNNPITHLYNDFLIQTVNLKLLSIRCIPFKEMNPDPFYGSKINFIITEDYHICCTASSGTVCTAYQPWFISCSDILPLKSMKLFFRSCSILIIILNSLSIMLQFKADNLRKAFAVTIIFININDILYGIYLSFIWIADLILREKFHVKEVSWRSGIICLTAFATVTWFTVLSEIGLLFMSLSRLMVTISPINTRFKETLFVIKSLSILFSFSVLSNIFITIIFKYMEEKSTTSLCLPFVDPTNSQVLIKLITWFTVTSQLTTSIGIMIMHILLVTEIKHTQNTFKKIKSKQDSNVALIIQLVLITTSNILCWFPSGCVYISAMFLSTYPINLIIWTTVIALPINSIINPSVFIETSIKKMEKFGSKKSTV